MSVDLVAIKSDLSNFPDEVVESWLATFVESEGWPPNEDFSKIPENRWGPLLGYRPVSFWQQTAWREENTSLQELLLDADSTYSITSLVEAYKNGRENEVSRVMGETGRNKFHRMLHYLIENGVFPTPPVLLEDGSYRTVVDGYHRLAAYVAWSAWEKDEIFLGKLDKTPVPLVEEQRVWIATS